MQPDGTMQLKDIVTEVRKTLGEPEPGGYGTQADGVGTWDNSQIIGYVNEALGLVSHPARIEAISLPIALSTTSNIIPFPTDCLEDGLRKVVYNTSGATGPIPVDPLDLDQFEKLLVTPPYNGGMLSKYYYTVWAKSIMLMPYPQKSTDTLTLFYYKTLGTLSLPTSVPAIPGRFHIGLVYFALSRCQQAVEETVLEEDVWTKWLQIAAQLRVELSRKSRDRNRVRSR